jgi:hypothetical protein
MSRQKVTRRQMGKIISDMLGGGCVLPPLTEHQRMYLQATYELIDADPKLVITPPADMPPMVRLKMRPTDDVALLQWLTEIKRRR